MKVCLAGALGFMMALVTACPLAAQTPALSNIEAPYPALQSSVHIAGASYGPGAVPYGPVGTPLTLSGSDFGPGGAGSTILFPGAQKGTTIAATATSWSGSVVLVNIPSGATSGLVQVSVGGQSSNGLPLIVTSGTYVGTCPSFPPGSEVAIITSSLPNGTVGTAYSATLSAEGGTPPYTWSMTGGPSWLTLAPSTGALTGTPTTAGGPYNLVVRVADSHSQAAQAALSLSVDSQTLVAGTVYSYTAVYDPAGNVKGYSDYLNAQTNYVMGMWAFGYDTLNRLMSATPGPGAPGNYANLNLCMNYDSFGDRKQSDWQASSCNPASDPATATYNPANQVTWTTVNSATSGFVYDAAGNVLFDGANYYAYDAEGRLCAVQSNPVSGGPTAYEYIYDAEGRRVAKGTITASLNPLSQPLSCNPASNGFTLTESYVLGQGGEQLTTLNGSQNWVRTNVYGGAQLLATYDAQGLHFHLTDPLGTRRVQTNAVGVVEEDCQGLPFGDGLNCFTVPNAPASADESTPLHFTGKQRDIESGNDYFGARYYGSSMGRFMSPDPLNLTDDRLLNPSNTLNKYAYAANNPLKYVDDDGKDITVFYEKSAPLDPTSFGHIMFVGENQQTGDAAAMSFGPVHDSEYSLLTPLGAPVNSTNSFIAPGHTFSADDLRQNFASLTIQTSPEEAQEVIEFIRNLSNAANPYMLFKTNCTTVCVQALKILGILPSKSKITTPTGLWKSLFQKYANTNNANFLRPQKTPTNGVNYGFQPGYDPFQLLELLEKRCTESWDNKTNTLTDACN